MITKKFTAALFLGLLLTSPSSFAEEALTSFKPVAVAPQDLDSVIAVSLSKVISKIEGTKGRVAVMEFPSLEGKETGLSSYIANKAGNRLIEAGRQVVDRATLEKVISEQKLQQNSLMDAATAARVGKLTGAGVFIFGNYKVMGSKFILTVRALSVETGQFIPGAVSEETVKPVPIEMVSEINELTHAPGARVNAVNLEGSTSDSANAGSPAQSSELNEEIAFNKAVCAIISPGINMGKIIKIAHEHNQLPSYKEDGFIKPFWLHPDSLGVESSGNSYEFAGFTFNTGAVRQLTSDEVAKGIKGKPTEFRLVEWTYGGPEFPGLDECAPNRTEWNTKRGRAKK